MRVSVSEKIRRVKRLYEESAGKTWEFARVVSDLLNDARFREWCVRQWGAQPADPNPDKVLLGERIRVPSQLVRVDGADPELLEDSPLHPADYTTGVGKKVPERWYGVVVARSDDFLLVEH